MNVKRVRDGPISVHRSEWPPVGAHALGQADDEGLVHVEQDLAVADIAAFADVVVVSQDALPRMDGKSGVLSAGTARMGPDERDGFEHHVEQVDVRGRQFMCMGGVAIATLVCVGGSPRSGSRRRRSSRICCLPQVPSMSGISQKLSPAFDIEHLVGAHVVFHRARRIGNQKVRNAHTECKDQITIANESTFEIFGHTD